MTGGCAPRLEDLKQSADDVIILEGVNDLLDGATKEQVLARLRSMVDETFRAGAAPILATLTPLCCNHAQAVPLATIADVNQGIRMLAEQSGAFLLDFFEALGGTAFTQTSGFVHSPEGLHLTPRGYDELALFAAQTLG